MNRRQSSLDRPGILSPPGPFLTPSPSPSIPIASPRLAPSPSISPFSQDVLLVTNNTITNTTQDQERKAATPGRRQSIHQLNSGSPNAGTVVFQPSPSQSPAAATTVIGVTGNEFNTTLVGSNNISLNKKGKRLPQSQQYSVGYGQHQTTTITTSGSSSSSYLVNSGTKGQTKKGHNNNSSINNIQNNQLQHHQQQHNFLSNQTQLINPNGSPLLADSPIASPSGQIKPPTPQPQILHQFPTVLNTAGNHQLLQFLQGPQLIAAANAAIHQQHQQHQHQQQQQQHQQQQHQQRQQQLISNTGTVQNTQSNIKTSKGPQQILPKPQQQQSLDNNSKNVSKQHQQQQLHQISQSPQPQIISQQSNQNGSGSNNSSPAGSGGGQIIQLPTGNLGGQPLLLNQMPVLVQQNTPQGVQLILRPPTPQLTAAPSLVIHNSRPQQLQQNQQQPQLLRILNTNSGMQLATTPTFIVSSQANLIQQNLQQTLKANQAQTTGPITTLSGLQANPRSQQLAAAINNHIFGQNMAHLQNLQLNGNLAQIQMPNGLHGPIISQLPTQFQQSLAGFNQLTQNLNINQLNSANLQQQIAAAAAAAAANVAFQSPPPPQHQQQIPPHHQVSELQMATGITSQNLQFSTTPTPNGGGNGNPQHISITSPAVTPQPQLLPSVTPEPRNPTPVLQNIVTAQQPTTTTVLVQPDNLMHIQQNLISQQQQIHHQHMQQQQQQQQHQQQLLHQQIKPQPPPPKARKPAKSRKKKVQPIPMATAVTTPMQQQNPTVVTTTFTTTTTTSTPTSSSSSPPMKSLTSTGKLDLANVMKLCGIMEDDDYMMDDEPMLQQQSQEDLIKMNEVNLTSPSPTTIINQQQQQLNSNDFMITIPSQNSDMPFTFTIPANNNQCDNKNASISDIEMTINSNNNTVGSSNSDAGQSNNNSDATTKIQHQQQSSNNLLDSQNFVIKIDQNESGQPYTISIPSIPTANDIQQSMQQQVCQIVPAAQQQQQHQQQQSHQLANLQTSQSQSIHLPPRSKSLTSPTSFSTTYNSTSTTLSIGNNNLITSNNVTNNSNTITTANFTSQQLQPTPTITSRMTEIQNHLIGAAAANAATISQQNATLNLNSGAMVTQTNTKHNTMNSSSATTHTTNVCPITTTTAAVKPRRKQPVKRNGKKVADSIISTPVGNVPSQIGNIQISQIDATKITNQPMPISNVVENKIQIMPIIDHNSINKLGNSSTTSHQQQPQQIQNQIILQQQSNNQQPISQQHLDKTSTMHQPQQQIQSTNQQHQQPTITIPIQANAAQTPASTLISQLTGALSLAFSEDGGRLLLRHDPNNPQDSQSQIILQAVLSGALPNITIINEPLINDKLKTVVNTAGNLTNIQKNNNNLSNSGNLTTNNATLSTKVNSQQINNKNQSIHLNQQQQQQFQINIQSNNIQNNQFVGIVGHGGSVNNNNNNNQAIDNLSLLQKRPSLEIKKNEISQTQNVVLPPPTLQQQFIQQNSNGSTTIVVNPNTPKLVALPKIDSNQQLFSLNTLNNQITHISPGQTTASLGPMERLLIVPAGINAQQLAQCMLQGQIHFDNINPVPQAITSQQQILPLSQQIQQQPPPQINRIQQQIVHPQQHQPIQSLHQPINQQSISTTTKQVANVAPIIDTSKAVAKLETQKKKPKPRKPKVDLTNKTATGTATATLKPIQKLDLNTKPNTNPVQIVQPTTAKDHLNQQQRTVAGGPFVTNSSTNNNNNINNNANSSALTVSSGSTIHPFNSSQTLSSGGGTKLIGVTAPMQQITQNHRNMINSSNGNTNNNQCNNLNNSASNNIMISNNSAVLNSTNTILSIQQQQSSQNNTSRSLSTSNTNLSNSTTNVPPLVSVNSSPQTVTRVQTIQLTPQQQQLLKTVQIQIQQLSGKLQNKSLLSTLNIPADFDPNNPMYNKPLPSLINIQQMSDSEIHGALQRLFIEQQKILASGKVIPTIPAPGTHHNFVHSPMLQSTTSQSPVQNNLQQQQQQQQIISNFPTTNQQQQQLNTFTNMKQIPSTTGITMKTEGQTIPSNIVQPNNHNNTMLPQQQLQQPQQTGNTQRIHIYPLQHQTQIKPITNFQSNSNQFQQQQNQFQNLQQQQQQQQHQQQQQQKKDNNNSTNNNKQLFPSQQQLTQQQQVQIQGNQEDKSPVIPNETNQNVANSINETKPSSTVITTVKTENLQDLPDDKPSALNNMPIAISAVPPVESTKPKIARHALFERQLDVDQQACIKPDYLSPFQNKEEAVKRLIRYHCLYQQDEEFPSDEEIEFEKCAIGFQNKFQGLTNKFQDLILKESMLSHRTSELCLINHLLVSDIQKELLDMRTEANNQNILSSSPTTSTTTLSTSNYKTTIKKETEININNNMKTIQQIEKNQNISQFTTNSNQDQQRILFNRTPVDYINSNDSSSNINYNNLIKNEIKSEPYDINFINKCDNNSLFTTTAVTTTSNKMSIHTTGITTSCEQTFSTSGIISSQNKNITTNRLYNHIGGQHSATTTIKNEKENVVINFRNYQNNNKINFQTNNNKNEKSNYTIKKEIDNFDIESEITPSFIMKKIENILPQNSASNNNNNQSTGLNISSHSISNSSDNDFPIDFNFTGQNNNNQQGQQQSSNCFDNKFPTTITDIIGNNNILNRTTQQQSLDVVKRNELSCLDTKLNQNEPYDEWLCIQKELNLITEKKSNLLSEENLNNQQNNNQVNNNNHHRDNSNKSVEKELSEIFESSPSSKDVDNQLSELFTNSSNDNVPTNHLSNGDINHSPTKHQSSLHLSELINSDLININHDSIANKSVETRLEAMFGESPVIDKSDTSDLVESRLEELFNEDDDNCNDNNINRNNCINNNDNNDETNTTNSPTTPNIRHFNTEQIMVGNNNINHNKRSWSTSQNDNNNDVINSTNKRSCLLANNNSIGVVQNNSFLESQQSQFGSGTGNSRWMIDSQFDFINNQQQQNRNDREWNGIETIHINQQQQHHIVNKKINFVNNKTHDLVDDDDDDDDFVVDKTDWHSSSTITNHTSQITNNLMQSISNQHHQHASTLQSGDVLLQDTEFPQIPTMSEDSNQMHIQHHHNLQHQQQQQHLMQTNLINQSIMQHHNSSIFDNDVQNHNLQQQQHHQEHQHHHHHHPNLNSSNGNMGVIGGGVNMDVNNLANISGGSSGAGSMTSNFDDDINRHVQNAIDSILNLQNSESDSLNFSLDNSMGSFLADSPLDHQHQQQQQQHHHHLPHQQPHLQLNHQNVSILQHQQHCLLNENTGNINKRRSGRIDDLTDCLINGGGGSGDNSNMIHSPITPGGNGVSQSLIGGSMTTTSGVSGGGGIVGGNIHGITDFSCVSAGIDDAVKSIMTS